MSTSAAETQTPAGAARVLLISGSLRSRSTNTAMLNTLDRYAPSGIVTALDTSMATLPHFNPDLDQPPLPEPVAALRDGVHAADALLFCTPEYAGALPGALKNLLEWTIGDDDPRSISTKPVAWINVSASITRAADAHASLRRVLGYAGAAIVEDACTDIPLPRSAIGGDGLLNDPELISTAIGGLSRLVRSVVPPAGIEPASRA